MERRSYLRVFRKRGWIILLEAILTAVAAFGFSQLREVEWKSSIQVFVLPDQVNDNTLLATQQILRGFVAYLDSNEFALQVVNTLQLDMLADRLKSEVTITSNDADYVIQIDVLDSDVERAHAVALTWAQKFVDWRQQQNTAQLQENRVDAFIVQDPIDSQYRPQTTLDVLAGGIIGLMLGTLLVLFLESIESRTLRIPEDVEHALSTTVLGAIPLSDYHSNRSR